MIINDGSSDGTLGIIESYALRDGRIRVLSHSNMGLIRSLNRGLGEARGEFIARMDGDDISVSHRLRVQYDLMSSSRDIVLSGSDSVSILPSGEEYRLGWLDEASLRRAIFLRSPFSHPTAMYRRDVALTLGGYDESFVATEDFEF